MKNKWFVFAQTGEVIQRKSKIGAYLYFKRDGKRWGYAVRFKDIAKCL